MNQDDNKIVVDEEGFEFLFNDDDMLVREIVKHELEVKDIEEELYHDIDFSVDDNDADV